MVCLALIATPGGLAEAEDPLDNLDGTEGWDEIDTSAVDEASAWRTWYVDLRRWEAGRARLEAERAHMRRARARTGETADRPPEAAELPDDVDWQSQVDAARRTATTGGPDRRDEHGQTIDDERPWSRR